MNKRTKTNSGFIALMSAIIISIVLLLMITNLSLTGFYGRFNILDFELKERSSALAEACVDTALLKLANNASYFPPVGGESVSVGGDECKILSVTGGNTIQTQANYKNYFTNLEIVVNTSDLSIISWIEVPEF